MEGLRHKSRHKPGPRYFPQYDYVRECARSVSNASPVRLRRVQRSFLLQLRGILRGTRNRTLSNLARCYIPANLPALEYLGHMLTPSELVAWLSARRSVGHSFTAIGRDLGVSRQAVQQWLSGATQPSRTVLLLAEPLCRAPLDSAPGLPVRR